MVIALALAAEAKRPPGDGLGHRDQPLGLRQVQPLDHPALDLDHPLVGGVRLFEGGAGKELGGQAQRQRVEQAVERVDAAFQDQTLSRNAARPISRRGENAPFGTC